MRLIVAGAGWAGEEHVKAVAAARAGGTDCAVAALVDLDGEHVAARAAEWGIRRTYLDLPTALANEPEADAVVLATPHAAHREGTEQAARAGRHVLVEKPIALTLADADAMIDACRRAGVTLMVAESARFSAANLALRELVAGGRIGQPLSGRFNAIHRGRHDYSYPGRRSWLADPARGGSGMWMLSGIHTMSAARMLLGEVARVYAREVRSARFASPLEATVVALVSFANGAQVTITVSAELHSYGRFADTVLFGVDGTVYAGRDDAGTIALHTESGAETIDCPDPPAGDARPAFVRQLREFLAAVEQRRPPATDGPSERRTLSAILAGYESLRTGRPVEPA